MPMSFRLLLAILLLSGMLCAEAQTVYRWVDDHGEVHYGHAVPPEHARRGYEVLGRDGIVRERVEPAPTAEELEERRAQRRRAEELAQQQRSQEARDRILLITHGSEESIRSSMEMELVALNSQRASIRVAVDQVEHRFERLLAQAAEHSEAGRPLPATLEQSLEEVRAELRRLRSDQAALDEREETIRARYDSDIQRFHELMGRGAGS
jgi:predicted  nucleic acid-binding Zn-ribbon protein